jgi:hypothetical protein
MERRAGNLGLGICVRARPGRQRLPKPARRKARRSLRPADALCCRTAVAPSGTMGRGRLFGRVRYHVCLRRRIPNQTIKSLRGSRKGLLGLSCNRRNKHTDDKAHDRKILHRNLLRLEVESSTACEIGLTQRSVLCGIAAIAGIVRQYRCLSKTISPTADSSCHCEFCRS